MGEPPRFKELAPLNMNHLTTPYTQIARMSAKSAYAVLISSWPSQRKPSSSVGNPSFSVRETSLSICCWAGAAWLQDARAKRRSF